MNKKGLSNLVASVLLIVFVISLGLIVVNWSGKLIGRSVEKSETKIGTDLECTNVNLALEMKEGTTIFIIKNNNKGKLDIKGFITRFGMKTGNAIVDYAHKEQEIKNYGAFSFDYKTSEKKSPLGEVITLNGEVSSIEVIPRIDIGDSQIVDCETKKSKWVI